MTILPPDMAPDEFAENLEFILRRRAMETETAPEFEATVSHCGEPMPYVNARTTWEGKPGEGYEITETNYRCRKCPATAVLKTRHPS
ncbi:hypothetical protein ACIBCT_21030 [Streptosporangium sp. NPDC050855]|uniref:hypothetical protein n=1 Tax=Streptosporangium sp. NPDC050855 TaxID=3366194 RepID=UPI003787DCB8